MRTDRRHELHTNVLADWLGIQIDRLRPYSRMALAVALGVVVLGGVGMYIRSQSTARQDQQWLEYYQAMDLVRGENKPEALIALVDSPSVQQTPVGYWAACGLGDYYLRDGLSQLFSNRAVANEKLKSAVGAYAQVSQQTKYPMLAQRALLEMGSAHEGLNELDQARKSYDKIVSTWPGGSFETAAKQRIAELDKKSTPQFYDWFFAMAPQRGGILGGGLPGVRPGFGDLPKEGAFTPPVGDESSAGGKSGSTGPVILPPRIVIPDSTPTDKAAPADTTPPAEGDAAPAEPPATDQPANESPAPESKTETPAAGEATASDPPAAAPATDKAPKE
jgi:hypothetical protein